MPMRGKVVKILSWNVNGLRSIARAGFLPWLRATRADIVAIQEVRAQEDQLEPALRRPRGYWSAFVEAKKKGYSGVGCYARRAADEVVTALNEQAFDDEARYVRLRFGALTIVSAYFPNGNGTPLPTGRRTNSRIPYKLAFYRAVFDALRPAFEAGERVLVMGDFNTAHRPIDLARPKTNTRTSGFTDVERAELDRWLGAGWVDTFRHFHPEREGAYSWWSQRHGIRARNIGWRLDLVLASPAVVPFMRDAFIMADVMGSDHCPVGVSLDRSVLRF